MNKFRIARAGVSVNEAIERLGGDVEAYEKLLAGYTECTYLDQLKSELEAGNVNEAFQAAHALKGVAGNLSLTQVYNSVVPVVETLRAGDLQVSEYMPPLEEAHEKVVAAVKDMMGI